MILDEKIIERYKNDPEGLAEFSFQSFFANKIVSYPVNPFEVLETLGIPFVFRNFKSLEGLVLADKEKVICWLQSMQKDPYRGNDIPVPMSSVIL